MGLKAYQVYGKYTEDINGACIVFAENKQEAKKIAWKKADCLDGCEWIEVRATRFPEADAYADKYGKGVVYDAWLYRELYFYPLEGGEICEECEKYDWSEYTNNPEYQKRWVVCPYCQRCMECGHSEDCPNRGKDPKDWVARWDS